MRTTQPDSSIFEQVHAFRNKKTTTDFWTCEFEYFLPK